MNSLLNQGQYNTSEVFGQKSLRISSNEETWHYKMNSILKDSAIWRLHSKEDFIQKRCARKLDIKRCARKILFKKEYIEIYTWKYKPKILDKIGRNEILRLMHSFLWLQISCILNLEHLQQIVTIKTLYQQIVSRKLIRLNWFFVRKVQQSAVFRPKSQWVAPKKFFFEKQKLECNHLAHESSKEPLWYFPFIFRTAPLGIAYCETILSFFFVWVIGKKHWRETYTQCTCLRKFKTSYFKLSFKKVGCPAHHNLNSQVGKLLPTGK